MNSTKRIVLCGIEGDELFSGYSIASVPARASVPPIAQDAPQPTTSASGIYPCVPVDTNGALPADGEPLTQRW